MGMNVPKKIPERFKSFFWDTDFETLDPSSKSSFVINRLLDKGNIEGIKWIRQTFPEDAIKKSVTTLRDFSPKSATFWATIYNIPFDQVICLQEPYLSTHRKLWPY